MDVSHPLGQDGLHRARSGAAGELGSLGKARQAAHVQVHVAAALIADADVHVRRAVCQLPVQIGCKAAEIELAGALLNGLLAEGEVDGPLHRQVFTGAMPAIKQAAPGAGIAAALDAIGDGVSAAV